MISVRSRLPRLNGNSVLLLLLMVLVSSCSTSKSVSERNRPRKPKIVKANKNKSKVDTTVWTDVTDNPVTDESTVGDNGEVVTTTEEGSTMKSSYRMTTFIPLGVGGGVSSTNTRFLDYYGGMKLASEKLKSEGANITINVVNSDATGTMTSVVPSDTDIIMGPYDRDKLKAVINYGKQKDILVVSPWYSSSTATKQNPNYIQMKPNIREHFVKMVNHVTSNFKPEEVAIVGVKSKSMRNIFGYIQSIAKVNTRSNEKEVFTEHYVLQDSLANGLAVFQALLEEGKKAFLFPNYRMRDEVMLYSALRRLNAEKQFGEVYAYTMPLSLESDKITYDFYSDLNMRIVASEYVDNESPDVQYFKRRFLEEYGKLPSKDAFEGFDKMLFVGRGLMKYGDKFQYKMEQDAAGYLHTEYDLLPVYEKNDDSFTKVEYYENKHLYVLEFNNGRFIKTK